MILGVLIMRLKNKIVSLISIMIIINCGLFIPTSLLNQIELRNNQIFPLFFDAITISMVFLDSH